MGKGIIIKTPEEVKIMAEGGKKLARVKEQLKTLVKEGINAYDVEMLATDLILKEGCQPSFKMVPNYKWSTCVNLNEGIVHGIPKRDVVFKKGDIVSVDVGIYHQGYHTDTSFSLGIDVDEDKKNFLSAGEKALEKAIASAKSGSRIFDISYAIESVITKAGYSPVKALVGHGVGKELHEDPQIPCFTDSTRYEASPVLEEGMTLAIEVMYAQGSGEVGIGSDGWTISASDGTITALFEDTIAVTKKGSVVLT